jgi:DNA replication and repair protein RecF
MVTMLSSLRLRNFRCFPSLSCALPVGTTVFVGENAQGKTSVLEAVCVLLRLQSPRTSRVAEMVKFGEPEFGIAGTLGDYELKHTLTNGIRELWLDGVAVNKAAPYLQSSGYVVWMGNGDLELITGSAEPRRRYLDFLGVQLFPEYREALQRYDKALRTRNFLLKRDASPNWPQIDAYTAILIANGVVLTALRAQLIAVLQPHAAAAHHAISGRSEQLLLTYQNASGEDFRQSLQQRREQEAARRMTLVGPHRDDLLLAVDTLPAAQYASEGQQRTIALALKLAQATLLREQREVAPVLLLDDIFGELDPQRRNALLQALPQDSQRLITTTHLQWMDASVAPEKVYAVRQATLTETE